MAARPALSTSVVLLSTVLLAGACGGADDGSGEGGTVEGSDFVAVLATDPGNLDPLMSASTAGRQLFSVFYDSLVYATDDGTIVSGLATSWEQTPSSVTFTLAEGITCADGSPFTATDAADNVAFVADPANGSPLLGVLVQPGTTTSADDEARTVTVTTPQPDGLLLAEMSGLFMVCRSGLDDHDSIASAGAGTGPYELTEAVANDHYGFAARDEYTWGPDGQTMSGAGHPAQITFRIVPNQGTIANLLLSGEVNYASVRGPDAQRVPDDFATIETRVPSGEVWFNEAAGRPTADPLVREALVTGVDRAAMAEVATGGNGQETSSLITLPPNPCRTGDTLGDSLPDVDQDRARQLLDSAGWRAGAEGVRSKAGQPLRLTLVYDALGLASRSAGIEYLATQWEALGVDVDVQVMPDAQISEVLFSTGAWDVTATPFTFNLPSQLVGFVSGPASPEGANFAAIDNQAYQTAVAEAAPLVGADSCPAWQDAERALVEAFNPAPLFEDVERTFYDGAELSAPGLQIWPSSIRMLGD